MDNFFTNLLRALGAEPRVYTGSFAGNGTSNPTLATSRYPRGFTFSVTRSDTGTFSVQVPAGCGMPNLPHAIVVSSQPDTANDYFTSEVVGVPTLNATGRAFTVLTHRSGTARDPAGRVNFTIHFDNSTGA